MNRKDRIAVVISVIYFLWPLFIVAGGVSNDDELGSVFVLMVPLIAYWGYRFIKGDISFIKTHSSKDA